MVSIASTAPHAPIDRFWLAADRAYTMDQQGWLLDRSHGRFFSTNADVLTTNELASKRCLVLLGEPGIGKSTAVSLDSPLVTAGAGAQSLRVDLGSYSSEDRLVRKVLEGTEITNWLEGEFELCLTLDGFDEAHTRIETLHQLVAEYLDSWDCSRLVLRVVCRTAEWPSSLEQHLKRHFEDVVPYELLPLRRFDAAVLAESYGIEPEAFLMAIESSRAVPLASRPLTLELLARTYKREGSLPRKSPDIYRKGLLALCEEVNPIRRDARRSLLHQAVERFEACSRLAALSIFSSRPSFWLGPLVEAESEDLTVEECSSSSAFPGVVADTFTTERIESALQTGIFTGSGSQRVTWAHATFADFLAACWVITNNLNKAQVESLLRSGSGMIYPPVRQIAAWLVAMSEEYAWLVDADPEAFLLNIEIPNESLRLRIASAVLERAGQGKLHHDYQRNYAGLEHSGLGDQIDPVLRGGTYQAQRIAVAIARDCRLSAVLPQLISIAMDERADQGLRVPAAWAVYELNKATPTEDLLPLLRSPLTPVGDSTDFQELAAAALMASWPHAISTAQVLEVFEQQPRGVVSLYSVAIAEVSESLTVEDLQPACEWLLSKPHLVGDSRFAELEEAILSLCLSNLAEVQALATATAIARHRMREFEPLFRNSLTVPRQMKEQARRTLVMSLLADEDWDLVFGITDRTGPQGSALLSAEDFDWLVEQYQNSSGVLQNNLGKVLQLIADPGIRRHLDYVLGLPEDHPVAPLFAFWRGPIELTSPEADELREILRINSKTKGHITERKVKEKAADAQVRSEISSMSPQARGGDVTAFWKLTRRLMVPPNSLFYKDMYQPDLTKHARWETLDAETHQDLVMAASLYLRGAKCEPQEWVGRKNRVYYPARAGYCALILLLRFNRPLLDQLEPSVWREWAPIIVGWEFMGDSKGMEDKRQIIKLALPHAREELTQAMLQLIDSAKAEHVNIHLREELELLLTDTVAATLLAMMRSNDFPIRPLMDLTDVLLKGYPEQTIALLAEWVLPAQRNVNAERAREAALRLLLAGGRSAWLVVHELMTDAPDFLESVLLAMPPFVGRKAPHLNETELAALYEWLIDRFPLEADVRSESGGVVGPSEAVAMWRENVLEALVRGGSSTAVSEMQRLVDDHPELPALRYSLARAEQRHLEGSWQPLTPIQIDRLASDVESRLVCSEVDLFSASLEALSRIQARLQGDTPSSALLWDTYSERPKSEDDVSDYLRTEMQNDLVSRGAVVNREVQVRRVGRGLGERTDLRVDAAAASGSTTPSLITVVAEVKGCWNPGIESSIQSQLVDRYMADLHTNYGIYIAIWFDPESWTTEDPRRRAAEAFGSPENLRTVLQEKAAEQETAGRHIEIVILDASRRRPHATNS